jgi:hypothetical protein
MPSEQVVHTVGWTLKSPAILDGYLALNCTVLFLTVDIPSLVICKTVFSKWVKPVNKPSKLSGYSFTISEQCFLSQDLNGIGVIIVY